MSGIFDQDLPKTPANYAALTPLSFIKRSAEVYHGNAKMRFNHGRRVAQHGRHGIAPFNPGPRQSAGQLATAAIQRFPVVADGLLAKAMHNGRVLRVDLGRTLNK